MKKFLKRVKRWCSRKLKALRLIGLKNKKFTIISNNCTGGYVYQHFGLGYNSPTAGLFFQTKDYVKLCANCEHYFSLDLEFIEPEESKNHSLFKETNGWGSYPVARLDDIEVYFMHYKTRQEAEEKWVRRKNRADLSNAVYMYCENEGCTKEDVEQLLSIENKNLLCFTYNDYNVTGATFSKEVNELEGHPWKPKIVMSMINWKGYLNQLNK